MIDFESKYEGSEIESFLDKLAAGKEDFYTWSWGLTESGTLLEGEYDRIREAAIVFIDLDGEGKHYMLPVTRSVDEGAVLLAVHIAVSEGLVNYIFIFHEDGTWTMETEELAFGGNVQSDWAQGDVSNESYIKNRTHYVSVMESVGEFVTVSKEVGDVLCEGLSIGGFYAIINQSNTANRIMFQFIIGRKIKIPFNGPTVEAVCSEDGSLVLDSSTYGIVEHFSVHDTEVKQLDDVFIPETIVRKAEIGGVIEDKLLWTKAEGEAGIRLKGTNGTATGTKAISAGDDKTASDGTVYKSIASGDHAVAFGYGNTCAGRTTLAQGLYNIVNGKDSVAFGQRNLVNGDQAFAIGQQNEVTTRLGVAIGYQNKATNIDSIAIGYHNTSGGSASVAIGDTCEANGTSSTAMGYKTKATGDYSATFGENTQATNNGEVAMGSYNKSTTSNDESEQTAFSFGIGTSDTDRVNALEIKKNGDVYIGGKLLSADSFYLCKFTYMDLIVANLNETSIIDSGKSELAQAIVSGKIILLDYDSETNGLVTASAVLEGSEITLNIVLGNEHICLSTSIEYEEIYHSDITVNTFVSHEQYSLAIDGLEKNKQDRLVSGTNIKTFNGQTILGKGNISTVYITDFTVLELIDLALDSHEGIDVDKQGLEEALLHNTPILVPYDKNHDYIGYHRLEGFAEDLLYFSIYSFDGEIISVKTSRGNTIIMGQEVKKSLLVREEVLKTLNGQSLLGTGDITIEEGAYPYIDNTSAVGVTYFTISPNRFYEFGECAVLEISLGVETSGVTNEYIFQFTSGETATSLTLSDDIKWTEELIIESNKIYQVSILNGLASVLSWDSKSLISFEVESSPNNNIYNAEEGMTWAQFIESDYNISTNGLGSNDFSESLGEVSFMTGTGMRGNVQFNGNNVSVDELIVNERIYTIYVDMGEFA